MKKKIIIVLLFIAIFVLCNCALVACKHVCAYGEWETVKEPTCTEKGLKRRTCTDEKCDKFEEIEIEIDSSKHSLNSVEYKNSTCTDNGNIQYEKCSLCKKFFDAKGNEMTSEQILIAAGHKTVNVPQTPATCFKNGNVEYNHCSVCLKDFDLQGNELSETAKIIPAGHKFKEISAIAAANHVDGIVGHNHCEVCGKYYDFNGTELLNIVDEAKHADYNTETLYCATCEKYVITTAQQFATFRDSVNAGNDYASEVVVLDCDIDLKNVEWTPIGTKTAQFAGEFDGQNRKISNLRVVGGIDYAGLFGCNTNSKGIRNFTVDGAQIDGGAYVAVAVAHPYLTPLANINVKNATIKANHYAGGIAGSTYSSITDCSVDGLTVKTVPNIEGTGFDNGDKTGGIAGYFVSARLTGCAVNNLTLTGYREVGGLVGMNNTDGKVSVISDNAVSNVTITIDQTVNFYGIKDFCAGAVYGRLGGTVSEENNVISNVSYTFVADAVTAQTALDCAKENTTVQLKSGEYGKLYIRQNKYNSVDTSDTGYPYYERTITSVRIVGEEGAVLNGLDAISGHIYSANGNVVVNPVTNKTGDYYSKIIYIGLSFENLHFIERVDLAGWYSSMQNADGLTFKGCVFDMTDSSQAYYRSDGKNGFAAVRMGAGDDSIVWSNVVFDGCSFKNAFQGIYIVNVNGLSVTDCTFEKINHNAVAIQSGANTQGIQVGHTRGNIVIRNNSCSDGGDRVIRFGLLDGSAEIIITDNTFTSYCDGDGELLKTGTVSAGVSILFENNFYDGVALAKEEILVQEETPYIAISNKD